MFLKFSCTYHWIDNYNIYYAVSLSVIYVQDIS